MTKRCVLSIDVVNPNAITTCVQWVHIIRLSSNQSFAQKPNALSGHRNSRSEKTTQKKSIQSKECGVDAPRNGKTCQRVKYTLKRLRQTVPEINICKRHSPLPTIPPPPSLSVICELLKSCDNVGGGCQGNVMFSMPVIQPPMSLLFFCALASRYFSFWN